ncbi:uncharacterized protein LOC128955792 [Oppia nitens]|uniref:uncharacterized protein LOC128955792 n=1 Tax=Oppia nitens TaxID=1686743 RepID=UPI0023DC31C5|nr:uncharacterized protein LOC128955792 [Oppia nitens]
MDKNIESLVDTDCLLQIVDYLSIRDKLSCRLVCHRWQWAVDRLFNGQQSLNMIIIAADNSEQHNHHHSSSTGSGTGSRIHSRIHVSISKPRIDYLLFSFMFNKFHNITELTISNISQLSDILMFTSLGTASCLIQDNGSSSSSGNIRIIDSLGDRSNCLLCQHRYVDYTRPANDPPCYCITTTTNNNNSDNNNRLIIDDNNDHLIFNRLSGYGWHLLTQAFHNLTSLTLRQCQLATEDLTKVIDASNQLKHLDIGDNPRLAACIRQIGSRIESLVCGDLSSGEKLDSLLGHIVNGNGKHLKRLSIFGMLGPLDQLKLMTRIDHLELHYYMDDERPVDYLSDIGHLELRTLVLEQIRCYEMISAVDERQFAAMLRNSRDLRQLAITGDYEWDLRLSDKSLDRLSTLCPKLEELTITGNGLISDTGIASLSKLSSLRHLHLQWFFTISELSLKQIVQSPSLSSLVLTDVSQITEKLIVKAIDVCTENPERQLSLTLGTVDMNAKLVQNLESAVKGRPRNLAVRLDNGRGSRVRNAALTPTTLQMIIVIAMSALILLMALLTTIVVVLVPLAMAAMMLHEYLFHAAISVPSATAAAAASVSSVPLIPVISSFKSSLLGMMSANAGLVRQVYMKVISSLI